MPYRDSIGQPAGYGNGGGSPYGPLQMQDMYMDSVLNEPMENPVADADMYPPEGMYAPPEMPMPQGPEMPMPQGPEMGMGMGPEMGMEMGAGMGAGPEMGMGPEMGQFQMPGAEAGSQAIYSGAPMNPADAGAMLRERLRSRQEQLSSSSMRFTDVTHELNK